MAFLLPAHDGCTCPCHRVAGMMHMVACCHPKSNVPTIREQLDALSEQDREDLRILRAKLTSGEISAQSPFEGMDKPWTEEDKARLKTALADIFGWDKPKTGEAS